MKRNVFCIFQFATVGSIKHCDSGRSRQVATATLSPAAAAAITVAKVTSPSPSYKPTDDTFELLAR